MGQIFLSSRKWDRHRGIRPVNWEGVGLARLVLGDADLLAWLVGVVIPIPLPRLIAGETQKGSIVS